MQGHWSKPCCSLTLHSMKKGCKQTNNALSANPSTAGMCYCCPNPLLPFPATPPSQVGGVCKLSAESSQRRCKTPDGRICSGNGECDCGVCICHVTEPGRYYGPRCECHDWVCSTHDGKTCAGKWHTAVIHYSAWVCHRWMCEVTDTVYSFRSLS